MASLLSAGESALAGAAPAAGASKLEEPDHSSSNWYFTREEIERNSPSRKDSIDLKRETYFRKSYCTFLQDLGMRLKVPQVTIATAIVFCHRFFLRQSHHKNDRLMIATICMFLAGKVEETPRGLVDVILMSYEIRFKKDQAAIQRIKQNQKEVVEEQKELVLVGERLVLTTLGFDLNIHHPYKPLVAAIKKFKVAQNALAQVAWNFVNDGLRTSLCLQFKPHHIAAGAIFLAAKFLKVKLPSDGEKVWWQEFDVTPRQLEEVSNQMLELYEQTGGVATTGAGSRSSDPSASVGVAGNRNKTGQTCQSKFELPALKAETAEEEWKASAGPEEINQEPQIQVKTDAVVEKSEKSSQLSQDREALEEERKPWVGLDDISKDKVKAALARRKSSDEGETKPKLGFGDDDELLERALEADLETSALDVERANHERRDVKSKHGHRVEHDLPEVKKDRAEEVENAYKSKRPEDEDVPASDRRWGKVSENGDVREGPEELEIVAKRKRNQWEDLPGGDKRPPRPVDKVDAREVDVGKVEVAEVAPERGEDGELPTTSVQEPARSPRAPERTRQMSSADRSASPSSHKRRWENREPRDMKDNRDGRDVKDIREMKDVRDSRDSKESNRDIRDGRDNRDGRDTRESHRGRDGGTHEKWGGENRSNGTAMHRHGHNRGDGYYHHSNSHQHHHGDRERHHRDWQERERDYKKSRHDQETLQPVPLRSSVF